jgi:hypothetical protein
MEKMAVVSEKEKIQILCKHAEQKKVRKKEERIFIYLLRAVHCYRQTNSIV